MTKIKVSLDEQLEALEWIIGEAHQNRRLQPDTMRAAGAALATLKLFRKFETPVRATLERCLAELRDLEDHPAVKAVTDAFPDAQVSIRETER